MRLNYLLFQICLVCFCVTTKAQSTQLLKTFEVEQAKQAVAVDNDFFYVINNRAISKYAKETGLFVATWNDEEKILKHMNSGIVINNKLYCAHSNYPDCPMASSIEIFDTKTLNHIGNHSLGIQYGSATWIDFYQKSWWICYANYTGRGGCESKDNSWTVLVQYDTNWRSIASWILPPELIERFNGRSNSGGCWSKDGKLYLTGHDAAELYVMSLPTRGFTLKLEKIIPMEAQGQGFAFDQSITDKTVIYGIKRSEKQIVVMKIME